MYKYRKDTLETGFRTVQKRLHVKREKNKTNYATRCVQKIYMTHTKSWHHQLISKVIVTHMYTTDTNSTRLVE